MCLASVESDSDLLGSGISLPVSSLLRPLSATCTYPSCKQTNLYTQPHLASPPWSIAGSPLGAVRCAGLVASRYGFTLSSIHVDRYSPIQCDETKPKCNQCAKSRRECPGYKDEFDLVFRNETQATERRARKANKKAIAKLNKDSESAQPPAPIAGYSSQVAIKNPRIPLDQQAECHFVANWILIPRQGGTRGFMEYLVPLLRNESQTYHFRMAFDACALASLNNRVGSGHDFEKESLGLYTKALSATFAALKDPVQGTADTTLAAILLLGLYENISARQMGMLAWGSHIEGAIQLVKARGRSILNTQTGRWLFIAVRTQMVCQLRTNSGTCANPFRSSTRSARARHRSWVWNGGSPMPFKTSTQRSVRNSTSESESFARRSIG